MKDWKTTLFGAMVTAGMGLQASPNPDYQLYGKILAGAGALGVGYFAKDADMKPEVKPETKLEIKK